MGFGVCEEMRAMGAARLVLSWIIFAATLCAQSVAPPPDGVPPPVNDPPTFSFGDGTMSGARLQPYDNAFAVTWTHEDGSKQDAGIWSDQLRLREVDGHKAFVRTQGFVYSDGTSMWSVNRFD